jgi:hypothetical protein
VLLLLPDAAAEVQQAEAVRELAVAGDVDRVGGGEEAGGDESLRDGVSAAVARLAVLQPAAVPALALRLAEAAGLARLATLKQVELPQVIKRAACKVVGQSSMIGLMMAVNS